MEQLITSKIYGTLPDILRESTDKRCGTWWSRPLNLNEWSFCALGTVLHKMEQHPLIIMLGGAGKEKIAEYCGINPEYVNKKTQCQICKAIRSTVGMVAHYNDRHHLSYKENADMLEKTEFYKETTKQQKYIDMFARNVDGSIRKVRASIVKTLVKN
jgi:hypothetical protein